MSSAQTISLTEILDLAGDIPSEGILSILGRVAHKAKEGKIDLNAPPEEVAQLYQRFQSNEEVERTFSYLFAKAGEERKAGDAYSKLILFLEQRGAYGMAGDAAMEADRLFGGTLLFKVKAEELYERQIKQMDEERSRGDEINEGYYDEMLFKAGKIDPFRRSVEPKLKYWLGRGEFGVAAGMCDKLGRPQEAKRYRQSAEILNES